MSGACPAWSAWTACDTGTCASTSACYEVQDLIITTSRELCGTYNVDEFVVQGGAKVTCASGDLRSQASYDSDAVWTTTATASAMLTEDSSGQSITEFAYYLHVATEDLFGNIGAIAHRRVLIGTAPAQVALYGYVKDAAAGQALVGAELRLEPFGLLRTTQVAGYFLIDGAYAATYTALVTWPGGTFTVPIVVSATASPMTVRPAP